MIGIIVTGHGSFATGLTSGLRLLAGEPEEYRAVDFDPEESLEVLTRDLEQALKELKECQGVLILADLVGGSPYNVSVRLKMEGRYNIQVMGGANLPILLDAYMNHTSDDPAVVAGNSLEAGKAQTLCFVPDGAQDQGEEDEVELD